MPKRIQNCNIEFAFECPKEWSNLTPTVRDNIRFCQTCSKEVFFCETPREAEDHASRGHCVAVQFEDKTEGKESIQEKLERVRKPRVGIIYDL